MLKSFIPSVRQVIGFFVVLIIVNAITNALNISNLVYNPVEFFKSKFGKIAR